MQIKPEMIREQVFRTSLRGFDREEVRGFLMVVADTMEDLVDENLALRAELENLRSKQRDLEELFIQAKRFSDERFAQANYDAQRIIDDAEQRAAAIQEKGQHIIARAEQEAREREDLARQKAREIIFEVEKTKVSLERQIIELKNRKLSLFADLKGKLEASQAWLKEIGDVDTQ
ncbi:MAG TPA: DivIVA domain-containing protein [Deltaproteobacteria bacterium]|nr:DivIVA domain-containing protein [Deltaproteobacteria bacterium]